MRFLALPHDFAIGAKNGAIVRCGVELESQGVTTLDKGCVVTVAEESVSHGGVARSRIDLPVKGWISTKCLVPAPEGAPAEAGEEVEEAPTAAPAAGVAPSAALAEKKQRLVVGCLHGTAASAHIFKIQCARLLPRATEAGLDLVFIEAPHPVEPGNPHAAMMHKFFGKDKALYQFATAALDDRGWRTYEDPTAAIDEASGALLRACGGRWPDAILGFSQGANLATMLAARAEKRGARKLPELFDAPLKTRALVVRAEQDAQCGPTATLPDGPTEQARLFADAAMLSHPGNHAPFPGGQHQAAADKLADDIVSFLRGDN